MHQYPAVIHPSHMHVYWQGNNLSMHFDIPKPKFPRIQSTQTQNWVPTHRHRTSYSSDTSIIDDSNNNYNESKASDHLANGFPWSDENDSKMNDSSNNSSLYKDHFADLLVSCDGSCGSQLGLILHSCKHCYDKGDKGCVKNCDLCKKANQFAIEDNLDKVFDKYFWNINDPIRQCLIKNLEELRCVENTSASNNFETIYNELRDENVYIQGKLWSKKLMKLFYDLLLSKYESILTKVANESCKSHSLTLWEEIRDNIKLKNHPYLEKSLLASKIQDVKKKSEYKEMKSSGFK